MPIAQTPIPFGVSMPKLCLNCIVKNESERIERMLKSVAPYLDSYAIVDTGSTDDTKQKIEGFFAAASIPGAVTHAPFVDFEQARNPALDAARKASVPWDYLLLCDP